jgi:hypothetical protein
LITEVIVVLALFVLNGFFAVAKLAIVSSRRAHSLCRAYEIGPFSLSKFYGPVTTFAGPIFLPTQVGCEEAHLVRGETLPGGRSRKTKNKEKLL